MVGVVARLSLRLGRPRGSGPLGPLTWLSVWVIALLVGGATAFGIALLTEVAVDAGILVATLLFVSLFLLWVTAPLLAPGLFGRTFLSAEALAPYGVPARAQVLGLLLGALVSPGSLVLVLVGAFGTVLAVRTGAGVPALLVTLLAAVLLPVGTVAATSTVQALLDAALRSRRGRDLSLLVLGVFMLVVVVGMPRLTANAEQLLDVQLEGGPVALVLAWAPITGLVQAIEQAVAGGALGASLHLLPTVGLLAFCVAAWVRSVRSAPARTTAGHARRAVEEQQASVVPPPLDAYVWGPTAGAWGQQTRYLLFRSPAALRYGIIPVPLVIFFLFSAPVELSAIIVAALSAIASLQATYLAFSFDGDGFECLMLHTGRWREVLLGKVLAAAPIALLVGVAASTAAAVLADDLASLPAAYVTVLAATLLGAGAAAMSSVLAPANRVSGGRVGAGRSLHQLLWFIIPVMAIGAVVYSGGRWLPEVSPLAIALVGLPVAAALGWAGIAIAGRRLAKDPWRVQHLLQT